MIDNKVRRRAYLAYRVYCCIVILSGLGVLGCARAGYTRMMFVIMGVSLFSMFCVYAYHSSIKDAVK